MAKMSIRDAFMEAFGKGLTDERGAMIYVRARVHIPKVSEKLLREYYKSSSEEKATTSA